MCAERPGLYRSRIQSTFYWQRAPMVSLPYRAKTFVS
jgi:hypothetical protein